VAPATPLQFSPGGLVALQIPAGPPWRSLLERAWHDGGGILPVDPKLPDPERSRLIEFARPSAVFRSGGLQRLEGAEPLSEDTVLVVPTSGSTGEPKLVELGRPAIEAAVRASARVLGATSDQPWLCCLPLSHIGGLLVVLRAILLGAEVRILPSFDVEALAQDDEAAFVSLVPTMLVRLLDAGANLGRYRAILIGGSGLDARLRERAEEAGAHVVRTYGLTESCGGVVYEGRALPGVGVRVASGDEIQLSGPTIMTGYRRDPPATADAFTDDGWLRTRDRGKLAREGRLQVLGRLDRLIVSGGEKVDPEIVERALADHPKVAVVAVIGRPDATWGELVTALIVPRDPAHPPTVDEIRAHARDRLIPSWLPRAVELVPELSRSSLDKLRRPPKE
jgi:O-succinylbenzoic acid--CoA ligase